MLKTWTGCITSGKEIHGYKSVLQIPTQSHTPSNLISPTQTKNKVPHKKQNHYYYQAYPTTSLHTHRILNCLSITEKIGIIQEFKAQKSNEDNNLSQICHNQNAQKYTKEPLCSNNCDTFTKQAKHQQAKNWGKTYMLFGDPV